MLRRLKPYKAVTPEETINKIRSLFFELGLPFREEDISQYFYFDAYKLSLLNPVNNKPVFTTFGKGRTREWALASAWGEMVERVQNLAFYTICLYPSEPEIDNNHSENYKYYPDEKKLPKEVLNPLLKDLFPANNHTVISVPFAGLLNGKIEHIPFRNLQVIVGSNGMCSGNTKEEALVQGISEIFERHVLKEFYLRPFCPPNIALELFSDFDIFHTIQKLIKTEGYKITVKDCSLRKNYPVIGVLVENKSNEYTFHLGADPNPVTAFERCFTEMFQGGEIQFKNKTELVQHKHFNLDEDFWKRSFTYSISSYSGHWPVKLFNDTPDYSFNGFNHPESISDQDDLDYLLEILRNENKELFIRDNSFLGHPTYHIYIPGMSEMTNVPNNLFADIFREFDNYLPYLTNLYSCPKDQREDMLKIIKRYTTMSPAREFRTGDYFAFFHEHPNSQLSSDVLIELLALNDQDEYTKQLRKLNSPSCFICQKCNLTKDCNYPFLTEVWRKLRLRMEAFYE